MIKCDTCGKEEWLIGSKCKYGERKFCSVKCINVGRTRSEEFKKKISIATSGVNNPFYGKTHTEETKALIAETADSWNRRKSQLSPEEWNIWYNNYCQSVSGDNNHFYGKSHTIEARTRMSKTRADKISNGTIDITKGQRGLKGEYTSTKTNQHHFYDSFYELIRMKILDLDNEVISWTKKHYIRIPYVYDGYNKNYVPDFLIHYNNGDIVLEEVKGYENEDIKLAKFNALKIYCKERNFNMNILLRDDIEFLCKKYFGKRLKQLRKDYHNELFK